MTEPPRPPGEDAGAQPPDPTSSPRPPSSSDPGSAGDRAATPPPAGPHFEAAGMPPPGGYQPPTGPPPGGYQPPSGPPPTGPPPGGYQPPGGYPPQGGYPSGGPYGGPAPAGYASSEDKTWALVAHFGGAAGMLVGAGCAGWIAPLVALLARGNQSPAVRAHSVAALNFQLLWSIVGVVGWALSCIVIGFFGVAAAMALGIVFGIVAGLRANEGELYRYPATISLVK